MSVLSSILLQIFQFARNVGALSELGAIRVGNLDRSCSVIIKLVKSKVPSKKGDKFTAHRYQQADLYKLLLPVEDGLGSLSNWITWPGPGSLSITWRKKSANTLTVKGQTSMRRIKGASSPARIFCRSPSVAYCVHWICTLPLQIPPTAFPENWQSPKLR